jgi:cobalt-precorrin 5A hydrolase/precorrin-3B C17-methyltransferase
LPASEAAQRTIHVGHQVRPANRDELLIHPRGGRGVCSGNLQHACGIAAGRHRRAIVACVLADERAMADSALHEAAQALGVALRFASNPGDVASMVAAALPDAELITHGDVASRWRLRRST